MSTQFWDLDTLKADLAVALDYWDSMDSSDRHIEKRQELRDRLAGLDRETKSALGIWYTTEDGTIYRLDTSVFKLSDMPSRDAILLMSLLSMVAPKISMDKVKT